MNTNHIKRYAPQARQDFISAVGKRLNQFGIVYKNKNLSIIEPVISGSIMQIKENKFDPALAPARKRLVQRVEQLGFESLVEEVAYTWFNRFCALRFMELKPGYLEHGFRVLSHPSKANSFEILDHAQVVAVSLGLDRAQIVELRLARNQDEALYRQLLLGQCHQLHQAMPFLFEALDDETELLLPDNLTRTDSILRGLVDDIPEEDWQQVEVIGWLYQFYISEKKDQVIGKVVKSEDIPAATQLFTPNWIVKYLVQNSVGRQWLMTYPDSALKAQMDYYITPAEQEPSVEAALAALIPTSLEPEAIKVIDPACGSGHILVEAYDLLKAIYEERGYRSRDIPKLILENNLYGLDIDDRAAQLAGFALMMKARADDRRIFTHDIKLNVLALQSTRDLELPELWRKLDLNNTAKRGVTDSLFDEAEPPLIDRVDSAEFTALQSVLTLFEHAKTFGSLIQVPAEQADVLLALKTQLQSLLEQGDSYQRFAAKTLLPFVQQAWVLAQKYDAVIANPPYMGGKGMNPELKVFAHKYFPDSKSDAFAMFMEQNVELARSGGLIAMITMQSWMFLSSYGALREKLFAKNELIQMFHTGPGLFPELGAFNVLTTSFIICKSSRGDKFVSRFIKANDTPNYEDKIESLRDYDSHICIPTSNLKPVPDFPLIYWISVQALLNFERLKLLGDICPPKQGLATGENAQFIRIWYEVTLDNIELNCSSSKEAKLSERKWFPYNKGGNYRKWYGNNESVINWESGGQKIKDFSGAVIRNPEYYFKEGIVYSLFGFENFGVRYKSTGFIFDVSGSSIFPNQDLEVILAFLCSNVAFYYLRALAPTVNFQVGDLARLPLPDLQGENRLNVIDLAKKNISLCKSDWDQVETSWDFEASPLLKFSGSVLQDVVNTFIQYCKTQRDSLRNNEQSINEIMIATYHVEKEVNASINDRDLSIKITELPQVIGDFISYAIGCMMGRYSLDEPGLIYAHAGNIDFDPARYQTFNADDDGIIPLTDQDWFKDDATNRFRDFVRTVWGEDSLQANLDFVAESLCLNALNPKSGENSLDTIRRYLSNQFYKDHLKTYKKRPIYWLFSSGKQKAFEGLVYLHRYNESTLPRMRTEYVTPLLGKYDAFAHQLKKQLEDASTSEATRLKKDLTALEKKQTELRAFDDKLKHYADRRIKLDLDDGVKVNYGKFGDLLAEVKAITGGKESI